MVQLTQEQRKWMIEIAPRARVDFGPQWDTIFNMYTMFISSTSEQRAQLCNNTDVRHTMERLSADYNMLEAASKNDSVREQMIHTALVTHYIADGMKIDEDTAEMVCSTIRAVCMRHTIDQNGFSASDYAALTRDWSNVFIAV